MNIVNILSLRSVEVSLFPKIIDKLYSCVNFNDTRYELLKTQEQLNSIKDTNPYITVQFKGIAYMIFFCELNSKRYNILISKKELKNERSKINMRELKMFYLNIPFVHSKYYNGAIIDGKIIKSDKMTQSFIIHELYYNEVMNVDLRKKYEIIKSDFLPSFEKLSKIDFRIARLYECSELQNLVFEKLSKSQSIIIGLMFLNRTTKPYYVYTNEIEFSSLKNKKAIPIVKSYNNSMTEFKMKATIKPDVYNLYDLEDDEKIGIAHIPDIKTSHFFKKLCDNEKIIKVKCMKSEKFNKWVPLCDACADYSYDIF